MTEKSHIIKSLRSPFSSFKNILIKSIDRFALAELNFSKLWSNEAVEFFKCFVTPYKEMFIQIFNSSVKYIFNFESQ